MILVTGGTGLVGAHLLLHLIESRVQGSQKIRATYRNPKNIEKTKSVFELRNQQALFEQIDWIQADIIDIPSLERAFEAIEYVYHCAAIISFDPRDEAIIRKTNIEGTANIVNFCIHKGIKKLCYISSTAALGDLAPNQTVITEETEWNPEKPHCDYAISKYGAEMEVWRGQQEGLEVIILNPGVILGLGFPKKGSGQLISKVANGLRFYTLGSTGFVAVEDVARIAVYLMQSEIHNERFTLIAENMDYKTLLDLLADGLNVNRPKHHVSPFLMEVAWRVDWVITLLLNKKRTLTQTTAKASYSSTEFSNEKIKTAIPFQLTPITEYITKITKQL
jgi:nucleoside-diphosphate-sugar epimerase